MWKSIALSYLRLFAGGAVTAFVVLDKNVFDLTLLDAKTIVGAGIGAAAVVAANALNPRDKRYGVGAKRST